MLVIVVYRPPRGESYTSFFNRVEDLVALSGCSILMGDFNYNLGGPDPEAGEFLEFLHSLGYRVPRFAHTYVDHHGGSELDILGCIGLELLKSRTGDFSLPGGHLPIYVSFELGSCTLSGLVDDIPRRDFRGYTPRIILAESSVLRLVFFGSGTLTLSLG